jgi:hypothetical protein
VTRFSSVLLVGAVACAPAGMPTPQAPPAQHGPQVEGGGAVREEFVGLVPPGHGTLRQDDVTLALESGALLIKVTPLDESVIRLTAPDTYARLHNLATSRRLEAGRAAPGEVPELFLVSFFSRQPDVTFEPEDLQLNHQGRTLQPRAILPLTPAWGRQRLQQQETLTAVYVFTPQIDYQQPIGVRYGMVQNDEWARIIPKLDVERGKVRARAGG